MLRITSHDSPGNVTLRLEGDLAGVWVCEFLSAWRAAGQPVTRIDLTGVDHVDRAGEYALALIHHSGTQLVGSGVRIVDLIQTIARDWPRDSTIAREA